MAQLSVINHLTWKQVSLISFTFLLITAGIHAQNAMRSPTNTQSKAGVVIPTPYQPGTEWYPGPPILTRLEPWFGKPGDTVRLRGDNFGREKWQSHIQINGINAEILNWSNQAIDIKLPQTSSGNLNLIRGDQQSTSLPVSLYQSVGSPELYFQQGKLWLKNLTLPALLTINSGQEYALTPSPNQAITDLNYPQLIHASLKDVSGQLLPLAMPAESLINP